MQRTKKRSPMESMSATIVPWRKRFVKVQIMLRTADGILSIDQSYLAIEMSRHFAAIWTTIGNGCKPHACCDGRPVRVACVGQLTASKYRAQREWVHRSKEFHCLWRQIGSDIKTMLLGITKPEGISWTGLDQNYRDPARGRL